MHMPWGSQLNQLHCTFVRQTPVYGNNPWVKPWYQENPGLQPGPMFETHIYRYYDIQEKNISAAEYLNNSLMFCCFNSAPQPPNHPFPPPPGPDNLVP